MNIQIKICFNAEILHTPTNGGGASLRWVINVGDEDDIQLGLQSLPSNLAFIEGRPAFRRDACAGQMLHKISLAGDCERAGPLKGPKPILFSTSPDMARGSLYSTTKMIKAEKGKRKKKTFSFKIFFFRSLLNTLHTFSKISFSSL
jgi:hypothetical protein